MLRLAEYVRSTHSADGAVVLDVKRGRMFRFNSTGSRILQLLTAGMEENEIARTLAEEYSADLAMTEADTVEFLTTLREQTLIQSR
jgi:hypothetical protein